MTPKEKQQRTAELIQLGFSAREAELIVQRDELASRLIQVGVPPQAAIAMADRAVGSTSALGGDLSGNLSTQADVAGLVAANNAANRGGPAAPAAPAAPTAPAAPAAPPAAPTVTGVPTIGAPPTPAPAQPTPTPAPTMAQPAVPTPTPDPRGPHNPTGLPAQAPPATPELSEQHNLDVARPDQAQINQAFNEAVVTQGQQNLAEQGPEQGKSLGDHGVGMQASRGGHPSPADQVTQGFEAVATNPLGNINVGDLSGLLGGQPIGGPPAGFNSGLGPPAGGFIGGGLLGGPQSVAPASPEQAALNAENISTAIATGNLGGLLGGGLMGGPPTNATSPNVAIGAPVDNGMPNLGLTAEQAAAMNISAAQQGFNPSRGIAETPAPFGPPVGIEGPFNPSNLGFTGEQLGFTMATTPLSPDIPSLGPAIAPNQGFPTGFKAEAEQDADTAAALAALEGNQALASMNPSATPLSAEAPTSLAAALAGMMSDNPATLGPQTGVLGPGDLASPMGVLGITQGEIDSDNPNPDAAPLGSPTAPQGPPTTGLEGALASLGPSMAPTVDSENPNIATEATLANKDDPMGPDAPLGVPADTPNPVAIAPMGDLAMNPDDVAAENINANPDAPTPDTLGPPTPDTEGALTGVPSSDVAALADSLGGMMAQATQSEADALGVTGVTGIAAAEAPESQSDDASASPDSGLGLGTGMGLGGMGLGVGDSSGMGMGLGIGVGGENAAASGEAIGMGGENAGIGMGGDTGGMGGIGGIGIGGIGGDGPGGTGMGMGGDGGLGGMGMGGGEGLGLGGGEGMGMGMGMGMGGGEGMGMGMGDGGGMGIGGGDGGMGGMGGMGGDGGGMGGMGGGAGGGGMGGGGDSGEGGSGGVGGASGGGDGGW